MKSEPVITAAGLVKRYPTATALDGIDLEIARGEVFGLIGPNGAGKTTLIRSIVGALRPTDGTVTVLGLDPLRDRWELRGQIGYMPQQPALYPDLSVRRNVSFFAAAHRGHVSVDDVDPALELVGMSERADDPVHTLSGGMQQRVSLACAIVHQPEVLLLDEPTAGIDPELRAAFWERFHGWAWAGSTVIVSTHQMGEALECDRVALLRAGRVVAAESPTQLFRSGRATARVWRGGREEVVSLADYPSQLPGVAAGADRVEIELEPLDDIVLRLIAQGGGDVT
jgi:ABC-2 type transport system ATP-binding protein